MTAPRPAPSLSAPSALDAVFHALANEHRREIVCALGLQPAAIGPLAAFRQLSLPAMSKHVDVLERAGLIHRHKRGRTTFLTLNPAPLGLLQAWTGQFQTHWGQGVGTYENYQDTLSDQTSRTTQPARTARTHPSGPRKDRP